MPGLFQRLFSPRWRHKDPAVRLRAVDQLGAKDTQAFEALAHDDDPSVRRAALARIETPERLIAWHSTVPNDDLFARLVELLGGATTPALDLETRLEWVARLDDPALIDALIRHGDNQTLRLTALARVDDEARLIDHASDNRITAVRHAAAERVKSDDGLARLARQARRDKQVARLARERLAARRANAEQQAAADAERERILQALEHQSHRPWEPQFEARLKHWLGLWERQESSPSDVQRGRFDAAVNRCRQRIADHERERQESERQQREKQQAQQTREGILETLDQALSVVREQGTLTVEAMQELHAKWQLQSERWREISDRQGTSPAFQQRFETRIAIAHTFWQAWERLLEQAPALTDTLERDEDPRALLDAIAWPEDLPATELLAAARRQQAAKTQRAATPRQADEPENAWPLEEIEALLTQLDTDLEAGRYRPASQAHRRLRQHLERSGQTLSGELDQRYRQLTARLAELRDWRGFAAAPKREHLLQSIEALVDATERRDSERHREHQRLIREWRQLGDAAATREFAQRFRTASDALHAQLAEWESELEKRQQLNLETREALCQELETLLDRPAADADPDGLRRIRDAAQEQWDRHWPVPKRQNAALGRRYARLRHQLQSLIDARAGDVASHKRELVAEARQLADSDASAAQRADAAKALQQRWRALGRAPKGVEQTLWREFRGHCDTIFAARDASRGEQQARQQQRFDDMQALIDRLDAWQPTRASERGVLEEALNQAQRLGPLPHSRRSEGMERRWQGIVHAREVTLDRLALAEQAREWPTYRQWFERALAGEAVDDAPEAIRQALQGGATSTIHAMTEGEEAVQRCLVQLHLLADEPIPDTLEPLRLEVQVARLNDGLGRQPTPPEELRETLMALLASTSITPETWAIYASRFDHVLGHIAEGNRAHAVDSD
ncbi:DUF349 domain-containing protein [Salinicola aestuarinus]|uniref:DUF349 domain-containing protein n=1 Tax=Salinicola aestuarinus TaxID=1949082 RepID=UPI000DA24F70|nr:DUF349 domain-containing protein [Salinicola aestuarinus]